MQVRDAEPADAEAIREVHAASIEGLGPDAYEPRQVEAWAQGCESADYTSTIRADELEVIVADQDGTVVGFGSLRLGEPDGYVAEPDAEVTGVYVHPRVAREGVGTRLYTELERRARDYGARTIGLLASLNAVSFYETHGYDHVAEHTHEFSSHEDTGVTGTVIEMRKEL